MARTVSRYNPNFHVPTYATKMQTARLKRGLSQAQIAELVGTTQATYSRIESGFIRKPESVILKRISHVLEVPAGELLVDKDQESSPTKTEQIRPALNPKDIPAVLLKLKRLLDVGVIEKEEFELKKTELLARL